MPTLLRAMLGHLQQRHFATNLLPDRRAGATGVTACVSTCAAQPRLPHGQVPAHFDAATDFILYGGYEPFARTFTPGSASHDA